MRENGKMIGRSKARAARCFQLRIKKTDPFRSIRPESNAAKY